MGSQFRHENLNRSFDLAQPKWSSIVSGEFRLKQSKGIRAVEQSFGADVDYGQVVKFYDAVPVGPGRLCPPKVVKTTRDVIMGAMDKHETARHW